MVVYVIGLVVGRVLEVELLNDVYDFDEDLLELVEGEVDEDVMLAIEMLEEVELLELELEVIEVDDVELELLVVVVVDDEEVI